MKLEALVREFAECVIAQNQAIMIGDSVTGNKYAKRYVAAFRKIRELGDVGREALSLLLSDNDASVRVMAAAFLLRYKEERARAILESEANGRGPVAFGAAQALQRWQDGSWDLDPRI